MSAQRLSARKIRRISRVINEPIVMGWSHGGYVFNLLTPDHRHLEYEIRTHAVRELGDEDDFIHYTSCESLLAAFAAGASEGDQT